VSVPDSVPVSLSQSVPQVLTPVSEPDSAVALETVLADEGEIVVGGDPDVPVPSSVSPPPPPATPHPTHKTPTIESQCFICKAAGSCRPR
jgi:hypothetical protein